MPPKVKPAQSEAKTAAPIAKKRPGRPPKAKPAVVVDEDILMETEDEASHPAPKARGRLPKNATGAANTKKRGQASVVTDEENDAPPAKKGRAAVKPTPAPRNPLPGRGGRNTNPVKKAGVQPRKRRTQAEIAADRDAAWKAAEQQTNADREARNTVAQMDLNEEEEEERAQRRSIRSLAAAAQDGEYFNMAVDSEDDQSDEFEVEPALKVSKAAT